MPNHLLQRVQHQLDSFYPPFLERVLALLSSCEESGHTYYVTGSGGFRSPAEQATLYFQGRTTKGPVVTNARPYFSLHNYGCAVDVVFDADNSTPGIQPDWHPSKYDWLHDTGTKLGLQVALTNAKGERYDYGHVQLPLSRKLAKREAVLLAELKPIYVSGGLKAAWAKLDEWGPW